MVPFELNHLFARAMMCSIASASEILLNEKTTKIKRILNQTLLFNANVIKLLNLGVQFLLSSMIAILKLLLFI
jgi:hypothetical protein